MGASTSSNLEFGRPDFYSTLVWRRSWRPFGDFLCAYAWFISTCAAHFLLRLREAFWLVAAKLVVSPISPDLHPCNFSPLFDFVPRSAQLAGPSFLFERPFSARGATDQPHLLFSTKGTCRNSSAIPRGTSNLVRHRGIAKRKGPAGSGEALLCRLGTFTPPRTGRPWSGR